MHRHGAGPADGGIVHPPSLARLSPAAAARTAAVQYAFGAAQAAFGLALWPAKDPALTPALVVTLVVCGVMTAVHGLLASRIPWWMPYAGGACGSALLLLMCDRMWGDTVGTLMSAQLVVLALTISVFYGRGLVAALVGTSMVAWAVICAANADSGTALAAWMTVGPPMAVAAVVAQWLVGRLTDLVERDALTGVASRASWNRRVADLGTRAASIVLIDLDHFKAVNDAQGHAAGDELLCAVTAAWSAEVRPGDVLARIGGDEFALLLPRTGVDEAAVIGERLRTAVAALTSVTVGVTERPVGEPFAAAMRRADAALYRAKAAGRGLVHRLPPTGAVA